MTYSDQFMLELARLHGTASTCPKAQVGAVILKRGGVAMDDMVYGWNGAPVGVPTCREEGCVVVPATEHTREHSRHLHAEARAIAHAACRGIPTDFATIYITHAPCLDCAKLILDAGFWSVVIPEPSYQWEESVGLFLHSGGMNVRRITEVNV